MMPVVDSEDLQSYSYFVAGEFASFNFSDWENPIPLHKDAASGIIN